ncbi:hypothetical protein FRC19_000257 [Serendipita sp. 401]|nr:hypothetical protein FRC19_000257 [Serendipita sp. 401]
MDFIRSFGLEKRESPWNHLEPFQRAALALELTWAALSGLLFIFVVFRLFKIQVDFTPRGPYILLSLVAFALTIGDALKAVQLREDIDVPKWYKVVTASGILKTFAQVFGYAVLLWLTHTRGQAFSGSRPGLSSPIVARTWKRMADWGLASVTFIYIVALSAYQTTQNLDYMRNIGNHSTSEFEDYQRFVKISKKLRHVSIVLLLLLAINVVASLLALWFAQRGAKFTDLVVTRLLITGAPFVLPFAAMWLFYDIWDSNSIEASIKASLADVIIEGVCQIGIIASVASTIDVHADTDPSGPSSFLNQASSSPHKEA